MMIPKKLFAAFLASFLCLALSACSDQVANCAPNSIVESSNSDPAESEQESAVSHAFSYDFVFADREKKFLKRYDGDDEVVVIPEGVTVIQEGAFCGKMIGEVVLPEGLQFIDEYAFAFCRGLHTITFPDSLTHIGDRAFYRCGCLTSELVLPEGMQSIGESAFEKSGVWVKNFPSTLEHIGVNAFYDTWFTDSEWEAGDEPDELHRWPVCGGFYLDPNPRDPVVVPYGVKRLGDMRGETKRLLLPPTIVSLNGINFRDDEIVTIYGIKGSGVEAMVKDLQHYGCGITFVPLALDKELITLKVGETDTLTFNCPCVREWRSSDEQVVAASEGRVSTLTALAPGKTTVSAEIYGETFACEVIVTE